MGKGAAGDLETLGPPEPDDEVEVEGRDGTAPSPSPAEGPGPLTPTMKVALFAGTAVFLLGALVQLLAALWIGLFAGIVTGAGSVLLRTGGLEPRTFATCALVAVTIDAALIIGIVGIWIHKRVRGETPPRERDPFYVRRPVAATSIALLAALTVVVILGWEPSPYFPYPLATIVVLANAYFFLLAGVLVTARLVNLSWAALATWASATRYRAGFITATFVLLGAAGFGLRSTEWYQPPLSDAAKAMELEEVEPPHGVFDAQLKGLCLAAGELSPRLATSGAAPGCSFLPAGGTRRIDECFESLMRSAVDKLKSALRRKYQVSEYDADDAAMLAAIATCTREPPPDDLVKYFYVVASNEALRAVEAARRTTPCNDEEDYAGPRCESDEPLDEVRLAQVWESAMCALDRRSAAVVRRRLQRDESFREIGARLGLSEAATKDTFHNAIKKLRRLGIADCFSE